jgi:hypothetical protein
MELLRNSKGAVHGSWVDKCKPKLSLVYPTRTFSGRMKNDAVKLINELKNEKKEQMLEVLGNICKACPQYVQAGHPLARLCPPHSSVCASRMITAGNYKLISENYCTAIHPELAPYKQPN